ncbi:MAG: ribonuclease III [Propionibacteriaceae bacterium]|nr:ribonuclease III [Propionibacteriaceae bacterium]
MGRLNELFQELGFEVDPQLLQLALTHRSYSYEHGGIPHNERLEFLGDAVLQVAVTDYLYRSFPDFPEGKLAKLRAAVVNAHALADVSRSLGIGQEIRFGKGERQTGGTDKASILADTLEAILGAVMISAGRDAADRLVHQLFDPLVDEVAASGSAGDWKTILQEWCSLNDFQLPHYDVTESGPDHAKHFQAVAVIGDWISASGEGSSKKQAEQGAAEAAFNELSAQHSATDA